MTDQPAEPRAEVPVVSAATVLLLRDTPGFEVLMVKRHHQIDFASGALVFPGGKIHASDYSPEWERTDVRLGGDALARARPAHRGDPRGL